jgi:hypothetical protein
VTEVHDQLLGGSELVLVAQVPKAGDRWTQVHFNLVITRDFFSLKDGDKRVIRLERIETDGSGQDPVDRPLVLSGINRNAKIELDFGMNEGKRPSYPADGRPPIVVILELDTRSFRYQTLMPAQQGYESLLKLTQQMPKVGRGLPRVISTLDEGELRWPGCRLRTPRS